MEMMVNAITTSNDANSQNLYFSQNTFTRNIPTARNNVQYLQGAHQFQSSYGIFTTSNPVFLLAVTIMIQNSINYIKNPNDHFGYCSLMDSKCICGHLE